METLATGKWQNWMITNTIEPKNVLLVLVVPVSSDNSFVDLNSDKSL